MLLTKTSKTMIKSIPLFIFGSLFFFNQLSAQDFKEQFDDLFSKNDTTAELQLFEKWEQSNNNDPELYVAYLNYYVKKSRKDMITIGNHPKGDNVLELTGKDSANQGQKSYVYNDTRYNLTTLQKGFDYIDKGIKINPTRLDMRFGKIYMLGEIEDYENFTNEIIKAIEYSSIINNKWTWANNAPQKDPKKFFLGSVQTYVMQIYDTENDALLIYMKRIAEAVLKYYPDHIESLSNLAIVYLINKEYDKALEPLLKAEKLDPKDFIVLNNIARAYTLKGDNKNALKYYELTAKYGDDEAKKHAEQEIKKLKKK